MANRPLRNWWAALLVPVGQPSLLMSGCVGYKTRSIRSDDRLKFPAGPEVLKTSTSGRPEPGPKYLGGGDRQGLTRWQEQKPCSSE